MSGVTSMRETLWMFVELAGLAAIVAGVWLWAGVAMALICVGVLLLGLSWWVHRNAPVSGDVR